MLAHDCCGALQRDLADRPGIPTLLAHPYVTGDHGPKATASEEQGGSAAAASPQQIIQPRCQGRTGHPVVFGRQFYADLMALQGDVGARAVLVRHGRALQQLA